MMRRTAFAALAALALLGRMPAEAGTLRVCADPNNLPFSNVAGQGFENRIVALIAQDWGDDVRYTWWAQRRGYVRNTLKAGHCDLWPGVATRVAMLATTSPYYRSSYVFITRAGSGLDIDSLDDPRLRHLRIGVQMIGNDAMNTPPAHALARRGITGNVRGYSIFGDYTQPNPPAAIVRAVARGDIDVALVWGPLAGYFAAQQPVKLRLAPVRPALDGGILPMTFAISMGVRKGNAALRQHLERELARRHDAIMAILAAYHVPVVPDAAATTQ